MSSDAAIFPTPSAAADAAIPAATLFARLLAIEQHSREGHRLALLDWVMALPLGLDPAAAARAVLDYQADHPGPTLSPALQRLLALVSDWPSSRLAGLAGRRRSSRHSQRRQ
ncbi:MAG: hypothetical protein ACOY3L_12525 [Pseudomonadota bacterium]